MKKSLMLLAMLAVPLMFATACGAEKSDIPAQTEARVLSEYLENTAVDGEQIHIPITDEDRQCFYDFAYKYDFAHLNSWVVGDDNAPKADYLYWIFATNGKTSMSKAEVDAEILTHFNVTLADEKPYTNKYFSFDGENYTAINDAEKPVLNSQYELVDLNMKKENDKFIYSVVMTPIIENYSQTAVVGGYNGEKTTAQAYEVSEELGSIFEYAGENNIKNLDDVKKYAKEMIIKGKTEKFTKGDSRKVEFYIDETTNEPVFVMVKNSYDKNIYDAENRLIEAKHYTSDGELNVVTSYEYDANGNEICRRTIYYENGEQTAEDKVVFEYDENNNNIKSTYYNNGNVGQSVESEYVNGKEISRITYDSVGEILYQEKFN